MFSTFISNEVVMFCFTLLLLDFFSVDIQNIHQTILLLFELFLTVSNNDPLTDCSTSQVSKTVFAYDKVSCFAQTSIVATWYYQS